VAAADVLWERESGDDDGGGAVGAEAGMGRSPAEAPAGSIPVATHRYEHVDDLPVLVDVTPYAVDLDVGLIHEPPVTGRVPAEPSGIRQQRCKPLYAAVDRDVIDLHIAPSQQLLDIAVDRPYRKYRRTATTITSAGNRKPANAEHDAGAGCRRVGSLTVTSCAIHNRPI
jgi:hypothetical protein